MKTTVTFEHGKAMWAVQIVEQGPQPVICFCQTKEAARVLSDCINALSTIAEIAYEQRDVFNRFIVYLHLPDTPEIHCSISSVNGGYMSLWGKADGVLRNVDAAMNPKNAPADSMFRHPFCIHGTYIRNYCDQCNAMSEKENQKYENRR